MGWGAGLQPCAVGVLVPLCQTGEFRLKWVTWCLIVIGKTALIPELPSDEHEEGALAPSRSTKSSRQCWNRES